MIVDSISTSLTEEAQAIVSGLVGGARYGAKIRFPHAFIMTFLFRRELSTRDKVRAVLKLVWEHASNLASFVTIYKSLLFTFKVMSRLLRRTPRSDHPSLWRQIGRWLVDTIVDGPLAMNQQTRSMFDSNHLSPPGHPEHTYHSFVAGAVGGYFVWGRYSAVNQQMVLYLASRVLVGLWNRAMQERRGYNNLPSGAIASSDTRNVQQLTTAQHRLRPGGNSYPILAAMIWGAVMALWEESPNVLQSSLKRSMDEIYRHDSFQSRRQSESSSAITRLV